MPARAAAQPCDAAASAAHAQGTIAATNAYLSAYGAKASGATFPSSFAANELTRIEGGLVATQCLRGNAATAARGETLYQQLLLLKSRVTTLWSELVAFEAVNAAKQAEAEARAASSVDDAKAAVEHAKAQVSVLQNQRLVMSDAYMRDAAVAIGGSVVRAQHEVDLLNAGPKSICGAKDNGRPKSFCGTFGLYGAALSYIWAWTAPHTVTARPRLASVAIPSASFRWAFLDWLALDVGGYSAFITKGIAATTPTTNKVACAKSPTDYENRLPCEANSDTYPYFALFAGVTAGRDGVGYLTVAPLNLGIAQIGTRQKLDPFFGFTLGVIQLNGSF